MEDMGMSDKQFNAFLRMLISNLKEANKEVEEENKTNKLKEVIKDLQQTLEE